MKFTWHIIKHDILRDRWALLTWALLFVGQTGTGWVMLHWDAAELRDMMYLQLASMVFVFLQFVMGYILVTRLVHADGLVGTYMFWRTRPVSVASLLTAKAAGALLLFGLLPVLLLLPWWLYCDFGWREIGWAAVETLGWQLLMIAPAFLVASLTDDLGRVLLWTLLLLIGLLSWMVLLQASAGRVPSADRIYTKLWLAGVTLIVGSAAIAAHQYLTRRLVRSVLLAAAGVGLIGLIGEVCPWNFAPALRQWTEPALASAPTEMVERVAFEVLPAQDMTTPNAAGKRGPAALDTEINLRMRVHGLSDGLQLGLRNASHTWTWPDGVSITRRTGYYGGFDFDFPSLRQQYSLPPLQADPETEQWMKTKQAEMSARLSYRRRWAEENHTGRMLTAFTSLPNSFAGKLRKEPAAYATSFDGVLYRMEVLAELPLKVGAHAAGGGHAFHIRRVPAGPPTLVLITEPALTRSGLWNSGGIVRWDEGNWQTKAQPVALNSVTGDISWVAGNQSGSQNLTVAGVLVNWNLMHLGTRTVIRDGKNVGIAGIDPQWLDHTKLVFLTPNQIGSFNRQVKAENYTVTDNYWADVRPDSPAVRQP